MDSENHLVMLNLWNDSGFGTEVRLMVVWIVQTHKIIGSY